MIGPTWVGGVLCGGASRRMGRDKALIEGPGGPWAVGVARAQRDAGMSDVVFVGGNRSALEPFGSFLDDDLPGAGPLAAVATLARHHAGAALLVCACDLPGLTAQSLQPVIASVRAGSAVAVPVVDGQEAWSVVALDPTVARGVRDLVAEGVRSLHAGLLHWPVDRLALESLPYIDVDSGGEGAAPDSGSGGVSSG